MYWSIWLFTILAVIVLVEKTEGNCQVSGVVFDRGEKYYPNNCKQKCTCQRTGNFNCVPLCRTTKVCKKGLVPRLKTKTVNGSNCTCTITRCVNPKKINGTSTNRKKKKKNVDTHQKVKKDSTNTGELYVIVAVVIATIFLMLLLIIVIWRCYMTKACLWGNKSRAKEAKEVREWSITNRPLPKAPDGKSPIQGRAKRCVSNPYLTDLKLPNYNCPHPNEIQIESNQQSTGSSELNDSGEGHYQEIDFIPTDYEEPITYLDLSQFEPSDEAMDSDQDKNIDEAKDDQEYKNVETYLEPLPI